jgi:hypothetical protein
VRGNTVMKGYFRNRDATDEAFRGGWFRTGDLAVMHPDGYIEIKDRAKDIIISGGENISTLEVEEVLYRHPQVMEAAVVAKPDEKWGETPCAFVTLKPARRRHAGRHLEVVQGHLAGFKCPRYVVFGELPKTSTGRCRSFACASGPGPYESLHSRRREHPLSGRLEGRGALDLMAEAAQKALDDSGLQARRNRRRAVRATPPRCPTSCSRPSSASAFLSLEPAYAHSVQLGGATGCAMLMLARELVRVGRCRNVLVGRPARTASPGNRATCAIQTLAQVGRRRLRGRQRRLHPGATTALLASRYMHETGLTEADLAEFAVLMRANAIATPTRTCSSRSRCKMSRLQADRLAAQDLRLPARSPTAPWRW